jgi:hypothetical protein
MVGQAFSVAKWTRAVKPPSHALPQLRDGYHELEWETDSGPRSGELAGNRTQDPRIKSALLYQLSYELLKAAWYKPFVFWALPGLSSSCLILCGQSKATQGIGLTSLIAAVRLHLF